MSDAPAFRRLTLDLPERGGALAALEWGPVDRPVDLVFLHANGFNARTYDSLLAPLAADGMRILAPDLRGHGRTRLPTETRGRFDWHDHAQDIEALLATLPEAVSLAGHSMGATAGLLATAEAPDRVSRLLLLDPVIWKRPVAAVLGLPLIRRLPSRAAIAANARRRRPHFTDATEAMTAYRGRGAFRGWPDAMLKNYLADGLTADGDRMTLACAPEWEASNYAAQGHDPWRALKRLSVETRILKGAEQSTCAVPTGVRGSATVEAVAGGNHFFPMLKPAETRAALRWAAGG